MGLDLFNDRITTPDELAALLGTPSQLSLKKQLAALDDGMRRFIAHSPFMVLSTHSRDGRCDASPRGDGPGFVGVVDEKTLLVPDRPGNKRVDSFKNILETGHVGLLFLVPGYGETLRVNGRAALIRDPERLAPLAAQGKTPTLAIAVEVEECYLQCAKAIFRSKLWEPHAKADLETMPCAAEMLVTQTQLAEFDVPAMQKLLDNAYRNNLY